MEFRILGPVEVVDDDGRTVDLGGLRERSLLARLLLSANRVVAADALAQDLWAALRPRSTWPPSGCTCGGCGRHLAQPGERW